MNRIYVKYLPTLPLQGDSPKIYINGNEQIQYRVSVTDSDSDVQVINEISNTNSLTIGSRQYYTNWKVEVFDSHNNLVFLDNFNPHDKKIFIKIDAYALGDNFAWMPYIEEFRKKYNCHVICSTFFNKYFENSYPEILFVKPNTRIGNVYAQYYIGANEELNLKYSPSSSLTEPLQKIPCDILGLTYNEILPKFSYSYKRYNIDGKYVCISEHASDKKKYWHAPGGWQKIVDYLNSVDYKVVVISREPTNLKNVIDLTGDSPLDDRMSLLSSADLFIGVSSGLSWVSWGLGTHVFMISDCTPHYHEFQKNVTRIGGENLEKVDYSSKDYTSVEKVLTKLKLLVS